MRDALLPLDNDEELLELLNLFEDHIQEGNYAGVDELLAAIDAEDTSTDALVVCLCSTLGARDRLANRSAFVERTRFALQQRGLDAGEIDSVLEGLE